MSDKEAGKKQAQILKELRTKNKETVDRTQALLKEQGKIERGILKKMYHTMFSRATLFRLIVIIYF